MKPDYLTIPSMENPWFCFGRFSSSRRSKKRPSQSAIYPCDHASRPLVGREVLRKYAVRTFCWLPPTSFDTSVSTRLAARHVSTMGTWQILDVSAIPAANFPDEVIVCSIHRPELFVTRTRIHLYELQANPLLSIITCSWEQIQCSSKTSDAVAKSTMPRPMRAAVMIVGTQVALVFVGYHGSRDRRLNCWVRPNLVLPNERQCRSLAETTYVVAYERYIC
jgi:hypothetical protein